MFSKYRVNKKSSEVRPETLKLLSEKYQISEEEINDLIKSYFEFLKERIQTFEKFKFRLLNIGTLKIKVSKIPKVLVKLRQKEEILRDLSKDSKKQGSYMIWVIQNWIENLENFHKKYSKRNKQINK